MIEDLKNRDGLFDRSKINIVSFGHIDCLSGCALVKRYLPRFYLARMKSDREGLWITPVSPAGANR